MSLGHSASLHTQPGSVKTVADILTAAADLIEPEGRWTQGHTARDRDGRVVPCDARNAFCYCAIGALWRAGGLARLTEARTALAQALGYHADKYNRWRGKAPVPCWNDAPERTQAEVVAALRAAAEKARTAVEGPSVGTSNASEPSTPANGDSQ